MPGVKKGFWGLMGLIAATAAALAMIEPGPANPTPPPAASPAEDGLVTLETRRVQDKVLQGSTGEVTLAVTLAAAPLPADPDQLPQPVDLVIVLDRSGHARGENRGRPGGGPAAHRAADRRGPPGAGGR